MLNIFRKKEVATHSEQVLLPKGGKTLQALVVESDLDFLTKLSSLLKTVDFPNQEELLEIVPARSLRDAIDKLEYHRFDIILTDINLADASGFLVLEELIEFGNKTPIIILSNISNWSMIMKSAQVGISDFLLKKTLDAGILMRSIFYAIERCKLETKAEKSEESHQALLEILPAAMARTDKLGKLIYVNDKFCNLTGTQKNSLIGKKFGDFFDQVTAVKIQACNDEIIDTRGHMEFEISPMIFEQPAKPILYAANTVNDVDGNVSGVQCLFLDISIQKQADADKNAKDNLEILQTGLANLANELNNSLTPIMLDTENLRNSKGFDDEVEYIQRIEECVKEARSVLRPFLVSSQRVGARSELLNPNKILISTLSKIRKDFKPGIQIEQDIEMDVDFLYGDASLLDKMFVNLILNACEASSDSGVIQIESKQKSMDKNDPVFQSTELPPGEYLRVRISDKGCGIDSKDTLRVFEPFYTTKEKPHSGIGLTEVYSIIKNHSGNLTLRSKLNEGTTVHLFIPVAECNHPDSVTGASSHKQLSPLSPKNILIIDNEVNILNSMETLLVHKGHKVTKAVNGAEALSKFNEKKFEIDLVITDYHMPVMNGAAFVNALRKIAPSVKVVLCSGAEAQKQTDEIKNLEIDETLFKPFTADSLYKVISKCVES